MTDILTDLADLHKQATTERSHYYTGKVVAAAMTEVSILRSALAHIARSMPDGKPAAGASSREYARTVLDALKIDWAGK